MNFLRLSAHARAILNTRQLSDKCPFLSHRLRGLMLVLLDCRAAPATRSFLDTYFIHTCSCDFLHTLQDISVRCQWCWTMFSYFRHRSLIEYALCVHTNMYGIAPRGANFAWGCLAGFCFYPAAQEAREVWISASKAVNSEYTDQWDFIIQTTL